MILSALPASSPELNPLERIWLYLKERYLSYRLHDDHDAIVDAACAAWSKLTAQAGRITSSCSYPWLEKMIAAPRASADPVPGWAGNTFMLDVARAGVRVFLYEKGYLHAKTISIDSEICSIGSTNIDIRSFSINYEINAVLYSRQLAEELEAAFERDLSQCCRASKAQCRPPFPGFGHQATISALVGVTPMEEWTPAKAPLRLAFHFVHFLLQPAQGGAAESAVGPLRAKFCWLRYGPSAAKGRQSTPRLITSDFSGFYALHS